MIRRDPVGVVASIAPWNYPLIMAGWKLGPALATGNTVVLKPSARTPLTALRFAEIVADILPGRRPQRPRRAPAPRSATRSSATRRSGWSRSPATRSPASTSREIAAGHGQAAPPRARRQGPGHRLRRRRPRARGRDHQARPATGTRARTAPRPAASSPGPEVYDKFVADAGRPGQDRSSGATRPRATTSRWARSSRRPRPTRSRAWSIGPARAAEVVRRRPPAGPAGRLLRADRHRRPGPAQRDRPGRGLRPGRHRPALHRRGAGDRLGERRAVRPGGVGLHERRSARRCASRKALQFGTVWINDHFTLVSETPARRRQGVGLRQGPARKYAIEDYTVVKHVTINTGV